jgi:tripartite-type tricarboxylate transporter receptor subunit TctC
MKRFLAAMALAIISIAPALAWEPTKPISVVIGNPTGAGNELAFRKLASIVEKQNPRVSFVIQNQPGADSVIAMNSFSKATPDGYTIALPSHMSTFVTNDIWQKSVKKFRYDEFTPVMTIGKSPLVLVANAKSSVNTPEDFVKRIQATKEPINVAIGGGAHRTAFEYLMFKNNGNADMVKTINFNGPLQAVTNVAKDTGGTEFGIMPIAVAKVLIESGKVKPIGFTGTRKMPQFPNVPLLQTVAPGIEVYAAWAIILPPDTPKEIVDWYLKQFVPAAQSSEYQEWIYQQVVFLEDKELTPAGLRRQMETLRKTFMPILEKIKLDD